MIVARPGMRLTRLVKMLKQWSFDGGVLNVSMTYSHIVMKDSNELLTESQRMFSTFVQDAA